LDEKELAEAMKVIDLSGDKRISFGEFMRWWTRPDKHASEKSALKLATLKTKLHSQFAIDIGRKLIRQLSGVKCISRALDALHWFQLDDDRMIMNSE
jgi:hypothetical protein